MKLLGKGVGVCLCVCGWLRKKLLTSHQVALPRLEFSKHHKTSVVENPLFSDRIKEQRISFTLREKWYFICIVWFINASIELLAQSKPFMWEVLNK